MGLPEQVRKAKAESDRLLKENFGVEPGQTTPPAETRPPEQPTPPPAETPPQPVEGQPTETPVLPKPPEANWEQKAVEAERKLKDLEQQHRTLDGKYRNETTDLSNRLADAMQQVAEIKISMADAIKRPAETTPTKTPVTSPEDERMLEAAKREFPDVYPWVVTLINNSLGDQVEKAVQRIAGDLKGLGPKVESIEKRVVRSDEDSFYGRMDSLVSDWRTVVGNPAFTEFLKTPDRFTGRPLYELLAHAVQDLDATRTSEIYKAFKEKGGNGSGGSSVVVDPTKPVTPVTTPAKTVPEDVAPPRGSAGGGLPRVEGHVDPNAPTITRDYIRSFYKDCALQKFKGREQEKVKLETEINKAVQEGRVE